MQVKLETNGYDTTIKLYYLAKGMFYHLDHDNIDIDFGKDYVTITFKEFGWHESMKLEVFMSLAHRLTLYTTGEEE